MAYSDMMNTLNTKDDAGINKLNLAEQAKLKEMLTKTDDEIKDSGKESEFNALKEKLGVSADEFNKLRANAMAASNYEGDTANHAAAKSSERLCERHVCYDAMV